jgi:hypothetical protein
VPLGNIQGHHEDRHGCWCRSYMMTGGIIWSVDSNKRVLYEGWNARDELSNVEREDSGRKVVYE